MSLYGLLKPNGANGFGYSSTAEDVTSDLSLKGKKILVTGGNSGLGRETVRVLSMRGAQVIGTTRDAKKAKEVASVKGAKGLICDLSDPKSIRSAIAGLKKDKVKLDAIICNAGIMAMPKLEQAYGYELQFFTNHIGHFILVTGLLNQLTPNGRIVMLSSSAHNMAPSGGIDFDNLDGQKNYKPWTAYGRSKFANLLFAKELNRKFKGSKKVAIAVHPGVIKTNLSRHMNPAAQIGFGLISPLFLKSAAQGAATQCYAAVHPEAEAHAGKYLADCNPAKSRSDADDAKLAKKLWDLSEKIASSVK